jgi:indolepyruvate ferredoxin oxidoreductase
VVANTATVPTGSMVVHPDRPYPIDEITERLDANTKSHLRVDARRLVMQLLGDDSTVNVFMVGAAVQAGLVPLQPQLVERAIELNGVAVQKNLAAFRWGRSWFVEPGVVEHTADPTVAEPEQPLVERLTADLVAYQSASYARRFTEVIRRVEAAGNTELTETVARSLHQLMAYKDEYEVARLLLATAPKRATFLLHPPLLRALGMRHKMELGGWVKPAFVMLRAMRRLRGTFLDVPGWAKVRRVERAMIPEYIAAVDQLLAHLTNDSDNGNGNAAEIITIAALPQKVRGYEHLKMERAQAYRTQLASALEF